MNTFEVTCFFGGGRGEGRREWGVFKRVGESFYARLFEYLRMKFVKWSLQTLY